jgi:hypothetical protein
MRGPIDKNGEQLFTSGGMDLSLGAIIRRERPVLQRQYERQAEAFDELKKIVAMSIRDGRPGVGSPPPAPGHRTPYDSDDGEGKKNILPPPSAGGEIDPKLAAHIKWREQERENQRRRRGVK